MSGDGLHPYMMTRCSCEQAPAAIESLKWLIAELIEFVEKPSRDEASDVAYHAGRTLFAWTGIVVVFPGAQAAIDKGTKRYEEHGCVRSKRNACTR